MKNKRKSLGQVIISREKSKGFRAVIYLPKFPERSCQENQEHLNSGRKYVCTHTQ